MKSYALKAAVWMIGAMISFSLMAISGRELARYLNTFEIVRYRSFIGFVIVLFLQEPLTSRRTISVLTGFVGVLIVARPDFGDFNPMVMASAACAFFLLGQ